MTAPLNLEALKQAALEATPGPWAHFNSTGEVIKQGGISICRVEWATEGDYIAAANPSVVLELIRRLEVAEKQRDLLAVAAEDAAKELERDGDEWGVASDLREAITSVGRPDNSTSARLVNCPTCFTAFPVSLDVNPLDVVPVEQPKEGGAA